MPHDHPVEALTRLFSRLFDSSELREFLRFGPDASDIWPHLPDHGTSPHRLSLVAAELLERRGSIDAELFRRLRAARPRRFAEIDAVAARFGVAADAEPSVDPRPDADKPREVDEPSFPEPVAPAEHRAPPTGRIQKPAAPVRTRAWWIVGALIVVVVVVVVVMYGHTGSEEAAQPGPDPGRTETPERAPALTPNAEEPAPVAPPTAEEPASLPPPAVVEAAPRGPLETPNTSPTTTARPRRTADVSSKIEQAARLPLQACGDEVGAMGGQTVTVAFTVDSRGRITRATASGTSYGAKFHSCVASAVKGVRLGPGRSEELTYVWAMK